MTGSCPQANHQKTGSFTSKGRRMKSRRKIVAAAVGLIVGYAVLLPLPSNAQEEWPQRQVTLVVPFSAGGSADLIARLLTQQLQSKFGTPFVVENRGGAGGSIAAAQVAKAPNDGYTLFIGTVSTQAINPFLYTKLPFDAERDFQPISLIVQLPNLLYVNPKVPAKTVPELITYLKANDGKVNYGSSGNGTSSHLSAVMFQQATGTRMTHVPFRSTSEELNSMMGGHIELAFDSMTTAWPHAQSGAVRAIAVTTPKRSPAAPDVPTIGETVQGYEATGWQGLFAPAGTPRPIVDKIAAEVKRIFESPEVVASLKNLGGDPAPMTPDQFAAFTRAERAKWQEVVKASGVRID
jgi:tripartite-type tricarboxylate transporter receptor subunit TctC